MCLAICLGVQINMTWDNYVNSVRNSDVVQATYVFSQPLVCDHKWSDGIKTKKKTTHTQYDKVEIATKMQIQCINMWITNYITSTLNHLTKISVWCLKPHLNSLYPNKDHSNMGQLCLPLTHYVFVSHLQCFFFFHDPTRDSGTQLAKGTNWIQS